MIGCEGREICGKGTRPLSHFDPSSLASQFPSFLLCPSALILFALPFSRAIPCPPAHFPGWLQQAGPCRGGTAARAAPAAGQPGRSPGSAAWSRKRARRPRGRPGQEREGQQRRRQRKRRRAGRRRWWWGRWRRVPARAQAARAGLQPWGGSRRNQGSSSRARH
jgi:hypothetical protein